MNLCTIHRTPESIHFVCAGRSFKIMQRCDFFKMPEKNKDGVCYFYVEYVLNPEQYPEFKDTLCSCKTAQNCAMLTELELWQQHS